MVKRKYLQIKRIYGVEKGKSIAVPKKHLSLTSNSFLCTAVCIRGFRNIVDLRLGFGLARRNAKMDRSAKKARSLFLRMQAAAKFVWIKGKL